MVTETTAWRVDGKLFEKKEIAEEYQREKNFYTEVQKAFSDKPPELVAIVTNLLADPLRRIKMTGLIKKAEEILNKK